MAIAGMNGDGSSGTKYAGHSVMVGSNGLFCGFCSDGISKKNLDPPQEHYPPHVFGQPYANIYKNT